MKQNMRDLCGEYDPPMPINLNPTPEQIVVAKKLEAELLKKRAERRKAEEENRI